MRLLVALHPGFSETPAVDRVKALSEAGDVDVLLYSAVYDAQLTSMRTGELQGMKDAMVASEQAKLEALASDLGELPKSVVFKAQWSYPIADSIEAAAEEFAADVILASTAHHTAVSRIWLRNVDWALIRAARRPILFAHHTPFQPYKSVLAAVDPTHAHDEPATLDSRIIAASSRMAGLFGGVVHLGHSYPSGNTMISPEFVIAPDMITEWLHQHSNAMHNLALAHGISEELVHMSDERPINAIPQLAGEVSAQLVVLGALSRSFVGRAVVGHITEQLLDRLECDVLTVPAQSEGG